MKKYDFLANVQKHIDAKEEIIKKEELGKIVSSLQRPFTEVMASVYQDQQKQVENLYKFLGWKSSNSR